MQEYSGPGMPTAVKCGSAAWKRLKKGSRLECEVELLRYPLKRTVKVWFLKTMVAGRVLLADAAAHTLQIPPTLQGSACSTNS